MVRRRYFSPNITTAAAREDNLSPFSSFLGVTFKSYVVFIRYMYMEGSILSEAPSIVYYVVVPCYVSNAGSDQSFAVSLSDMIPPLLLSFLFPRREHRRVFVFC